MTTPNRPWRQEIELAQNYGRHKTFTFTTSGATAETILNLAKAKAAGREVPIRQRIQ